MQDQRTNVRPGEIWELRMEAPGVEPLVKVYTIDWVDGDDVLFVEMLTATRQDGSRRSHMLSSPDWHRICEAP